MLSAKKSVSFWVACDGLFGFFVNHKGILLGFGSNQEGQLGIGMKGGTRSKRCCDEPTPVLELNNRNLEVLNIEMGMSFTLFLVSHKSKNQLIVYAAGDNIYGQLCDIKLNQKLKGKSKKSDFNRVLRPSIIPSLLKDNLKRGTGGTEVTGAFVGDNQSFFTVKDDKLSQGRFFTLSTGRNLYGQLGVGDDKRKSIPTISRHQESIIDIRGGWNHTIWLGVKGGVYSAGHNSLGELGLPMSAGSEVHEPTRVFLPGKCTQIQVGQYHSLFLINENGARELYSCGRSRDGMCGRLSTNPGRTDVGKVDTRGIGQIDKIAAGLAHSLILTKSGRVFACGEAVCGQLGLSNKSRAEIPVRDFTVIPKLSNISAIFASSRNSYFFSATKNRMFATGQVSMGMFLEPDMRVDIDDLENLENVFEPRVLKKCYLRQCVRLMEKAERLEFTILKFKILSNSCLLSLI